MNQSHENNLIKEFKKFSGGRLLSAAERQWLKPRHLICRGHKSQMSQLNMIFFFPDRFLGKFIINRNQERDQRVNFQSWIIGSFCQAVVSLGRFFWKWGRLDLDWIWIKIELKPAMAKTSPLLLQILQWWNNWQLLSRSWLAGQIVELKWNKKLTKWKSFFWKSGS